jgi:hypothetical protein
MLPDTFKLLVRRTCEIRLATLSIAPDSHKWQYNFPSMPLTGTRRPPVAEFMPGTDCAYNFIVQYVNKPGSIRKYTPLQPTVSDVIDKIKTFLLTFLL